MLSRVAGGREPGAGGWGLGAGGWGLGGSRGLGAGGQGFPPATMRVSPAYSTFIRNRRKMEPKELPRCTIPLLLIAHTHWQLEILVTALVIYLKTAVSIARINFTSFSTQTWYWLRRLATYIKYISRNYRFNTFTTINSSFYIVVPSTPILYIKWSLYR